jgi:protein involved in polysaccharide export with SLBB domain
MKMKLSSICLMTGLLMTALAPAPGLGAGQTNSVVQTVPPEDSTRANSYKLVSGDLISISVPDEPNLSGEFTISGDGKIKLWLLGSVIVADLSQAQVEAKLNGLLQKDYIKEPAVRISLTKPRKRVIIVNGEVQKPGVFEFTGERLITIAEVISSMGSFTKVANRSGIIITRGTRNFTFDYIEFTKDPARHPARVLEDGDVVEVPRSFF